MMKHLKLFALLFVGIMVVGCVDQVVNQILDPVIETNLYSELEYRLFNQRLDELTDQYGEGVEPNQINNQSHREEYVRLLDAFSPRGREPVQGVVNVDAQLIKVEGKQFPYELEGVTVILEANITYPIPLHQMTLLVKRAHGIHRQIKDKEKERIRSIIWTPYIFFGVGLFNLIAPDVAAKFNKRFFFTHYELSKTGVLFVRIVGVVNILLGILMIFVIFD